MYIIINKEKIEINNLRNVKEIFCENITMDVKDKLGIDELFAKLNIPTRDIYLYNSNNELCEEFLQYNGEIKIDKYYFNNIVSFTVIINKTLMR